MSLGQPQARIKKHSTGAHHIEGLQVSYLLYPSSVNKKCFKLPDFNNLDSELVIKFIETSVLLLVIRMI